MPDATERLIVALDVSSAAAAQRIVAALGDSARFYKVGMQLYTAEGPAIVRALLAAGRNVFLDLKYHDIPNTVSAAVTEAAKLGVRMVSVHALGGGKMLRAAVEAARRTNLRTMVLGVTVLTSLAEPDLEQAGVGGTVVEQVVRLATLALRSGCQGVIASAQEASALRTKLGDDFVIVTPGVRPAGAAQEDQVRVTTPAEAMAAGASYIVVGRPITEAAEPAEEARQIVAEMHSKVALGSR